MKKNREFMIVLI